MQLNCYISQKCRSQSHKIRMMGLCGGERSLTIGLAVLTQYQHVSDKQTDRRMSGFVIPSVTFMNECGRD